MSLGDNVIGGGWKSWEELQISKSDITYFNSALKQLSFSSYRAYTGI